MHRRYLLCLLALVVGLAGMPAPLAAQSPADQAAAAATAVELSWYEATSDFNALYDRIHPDAHAVVPRAAVIGWYENEFAPLGPGVATVTGVRFVEWTWAVTGRTYPRTAEVAFQQPFADGSILTDVVRLVQDGNGEWRWFFGRSREFVDEQIARYAPAPPDVGGSLSFVDAAVVDIDSFWTLVFTSAGLPYRSPSVVPIETRVFSICGVIDPLGPGAYCGSEQAIYFSTAWYEELVHGGFDFAWVTVVAHEWGHHVQSLLGLHTASGSQLELQADCLAGAYARDAATRGLLDDGDITEAIIMSASGGDPVWLPEDTPGSHGTNDSRVTAFMQGFLDGFAGCDLPIAPAS